ncbi:MAG: hypothetical protein QM645_07330 [Asticcacaulis sp.]
MKLYVPFYSRVYSILSKMKIKPWVEGNEKVASISTAISLIFLHQFFFLIFLENCINKYFNINIIPTNELILILSVFIINGIYFLIFELLGKPVERNKLKDYASIIIFSATGIFFYMHLLFS